MLCALDFNFVLFLLLAALCVAVFVCVPLLFVCIVSLCIMYIGIVYVCIVN